MKFLLILSVMMGCLSAQASRTVLGGSVENGGNVYGLEFLRTAVKVVADIKQESWNYSEIDFAILEKTLKVTKVEVSETQLYVGKQPCDAKNHPAEGRIEIYQKRWIEMSKEEKARLVLHEMLGLIGLEKTGDYRISHRYKYKENSMVAEVVITRSPLPLIPAKAVSCYSAKTAQQGQAPNQDIEADYFRIPKISFFRSETKNDLIISLIRFTYAIPQKEGQEAALGKCEMAGDELRALSSVWWSAGPEAVISAEAGEGGDIFSTDCALYCGGIWTERSNFRTTADVEVFGIERDPKTGDELPVKMTRTINIQSF